MASIEIPIPPRLVPFPRNLLRSPRRCDVLVLGSGLAGLVAAERASEGGARVLLATKTAAGEGSSLHAQGGIAAAVGPGDRWEDHEADTLATACGIGDPGVIREVTRAAPRLIRMLENWGARFDRTGHEFLLGREGGHARQRIVHAQGDQTGREVTRCLLDRVRCLERVEILEGAVAVDLLRAEEKIVGALLHGSSGWTFVRAGATILATGGAGRIWRETTNPCEATGDGVAIAFRAGAAVRDVEFIQFHPTVLYVAGLPRFLLSEALRGEGAVLRDRAGRRFLLDVDPRGELAPRDVVARAMERRIAETGDTAAYLDLTPIAANFHDRFPLIAKALGSFGLDPYQSPVPVRPAVHYLVGGVATDGEGRTSLPGLYAVGETASSGLHGANRLASNSLLECVYFGESAGNCAAQEGMEDHESARPAAGKESGEGPSGTDWVPVDWADLRLSLKSLMTRAVGLRREGATLSDACERLSLWCGVVLSRAVAETGLWELQNGLTVGRLVAEAARQREESRGVHFRSDHPECDDARWGRSTLLWNPLSGIEAPA